MMKPLYLAMMLGLTALVAACGEKAETNMANTVTNTAGDMAGNMAGDMSNMGNMAMPMEAGAMMAKGTGTVTALDKTTGSITIDHAPIPEANWPAMNMTFRAQPEIVGSVAVGDKVAFDAKIDGSKAEVTAISKQ